MFSRLVSPQLKKMNPIKPDKIQRTPSPNSMNKRNFLLSFGANNSHISNCEEFFVDNQPEHGESPSNHIENSLNNYHFTSNHNNISYLNTTSSNYCQEDLSSLENSLKYYEEMYEAVNKNYRFLQEKNEALQINYKAMLKKPQNFNPFLRNSSEKVSNSLKIKEMESELQDWKEKCDVLEKEHLAEMTQLKSLLKNSQFSSENSPVDTSRDLKKLNERFEVLMNENQKVCAIISKIAEEIDYLKKASPNLKEKHEYFARILSRFEENHQKKEGRILEEIALKEDEVKMMRNSHKLSESVIVNNSSLLAIPEKKLEFFEKENLKLEEEIKNWRVQYWNLEKQYKKNQFESSTMKYTEIDLKEIVNTVNKESSNEKNELLKKVKVLEAEIEEFNAKKTVRNFEEINAKKTVRKFENFEEFNAKKSRNFGAKIAQSEKKDQGNLVRNSEATGYKLGIYSNSLGNATNVKKDQKITKNSTYTEKILRKMKK